MKKAIVFFLAVLSFQVCAQDIVGDWHGVLSFQGMELRIVFHVTEQNGTYQSTMDSPDQGAAGIPTDQTTFEDGKLSIKASNLGMEYQAEIDENGETLKGTFEQMGTQIPLEMSKETETQSGTDPRETDTGEAPQGAGDTALVLGDWSGVLDISGTTLRIVFHINYEEDALRSTLDSPDQGAYGIQMDETTFENRELLIVANALNAEYSATLSEGGDTLIGTFLQNGMSFELILGRSRGEVEAEVRPQDPADFPYQVEEVKFENPNGGHSLAGTLTKPTDGKFQKVVILISGSGPQDRNEEVMNHRPFLVLSDHLTRRGIAVLRYDDRGVGESEGEFAGATSADFAEDASAALTYLKSRKDMKGKDIGLAGHSEGGMIAPMVAIDNKKVDFIVLLAGPGTDIKELLILQQEKIGRAQGAPESMLETNSKMAKEMFGYLEANINMEREQLESGLEQFLDRTYDGLSEEDKALVGNKEGFIARQSSMVTSEWYLYFIGVNPDQYLSKVKCPVLAVNGELDLQVSSEENLEGIQESLKRAKNKNVTIHEFKGLNHLFQQTETGSPSEYARLDETFNVEAMEYISDWILDVKL